MQKDIYVFCQLFYPELISSGQTVTELCESLARHGKKITVYCAQPTILKSKKVDTTITYKTITIKRLASTRFSKLNTIGKLINHITFSFSCIFKCLSLPRDAQLLVFTNPPILPIIIRMIHEFKQLNYILVLFDLYPQTLVSANILKSTSWLTLIYSKLINSAYQHARKLVSIGRCMKTVVDQQLTQKSNSIYIPIWADNHDIQHSKKTNHFRSMWDLKNKFIVGYSGNLARFHPIETLLEAAKKLLHEDQIVFLFVGEGAKKKWAQEYCAKHNLTNCIFKPYVKREELAQLLSTFDCGLVGLLKENTGFSVPSKTMGLLSAGVPVLACMSPHCEVSLILNQYNCGIQSNPSDSDTLAENIMYFFQYPDKRLKYAKQAKVAYNSRFNLEHITQEYLQILSKA